MFWSFESDQRNKAWNQKKTPAREALVSKSEVEVIKFSFIIFAINRWLDDVPEDVVFENG